MRRNSLALQFMLTLPLLFRVSPSTAADLEIRHRADRPHAFLTAFCFSLDYTQVITGHFDGTVRTWNRLNGKMIREFKCHDTFITEMCAREGSFITGAGDGAIGVWSSVNGIHVATLVGHKECIASLSCENKERLFSTDTLGRLTLWDLSHHKPLRTWHHEPGILASSLPSGRCFAASTDGAIVQFEPMKNEGLIRFRREFTRAALSSMGNIGAFAEPRDGDTTTITLCELTSGRIVKRLEYEYGAIQVMCLSPDEMIAALGAELGSPLVVWDAQTGHRLLERQVRAAGRTTFKIAFSPNSSDVAIMNPGVGISISAVFNIVRGTRAEPTRETRDKAYWEALKSPAGEEVYKTMCELMADASLSVELIRRHVRIKRMCKEESIRSLVSKLDDDVFDVRQEAFNALVNDVGDQGEPLLRAFLADKGCSNEQRRQIQAILEEFETQRPRTDRCIAILERLGTIEARKLLEELARGAEKAFVTRQARSALGRFCLKSQ
jgi:HEAT repeat protein